MFCVSRIIRSRLRSRPLPIFSASKPPCVKYRMTHTMHPIQRAPHAVNRSDSSAGRQADRQTAFAEGRGAKECKNRSNNALPAFFPSSKGGGGDILSDRMSERASERAPRFSEQRASGTNVKARDAACQSSLSGMIALPEKERSAHLMKLYRFKGFHGVE